MNILVIAALVVVAVCAVAGSALAAGQSAVIFDSTTNTGPKSNLPSYGPQAYSFAQIGGDATFAGSKRKLTSAVVTLSSWACVDGHWNSALRHARKCQVLASDHAQHLQHDRRIAPDVQDADVRRLVPPVRQPGQVRGVPTKWYSTTEKTCFNGLAQDVTFTFDGMTTLPDTVRYGITYGTSNHGSPSMGVQDLHVDYGRLLLRLAERRRD